MYRCFWCVCFLLFVGKFYVMTKGHIDEYHINNARWFCHVLVGWLPFPFLPNERSSRRNRSRSIFCSLGLTPWTGWSGCGYVGCHLPFRKVTSSFRIHVYIDMVYLSTFGWFSWNMEIDRYKSTMYGSCSIRIFLFLLMLRFRQILMISHSIFGKLEDTSNGNTIPSRESPANIEVVPTHNYHIAWLVEVIIMLKIFEDDREWQVRFVVSMGIN